MRDFLSLTFVIAYHMAIFFCILLLFVAIEGAIRGYGWLFVFEKFLPFILQM